MKKIKNGYVNKLICIVWVLSSFAFTAYADEYDIIPEEVEIIVTSPDSVVRMHIAGKIKKIKPSSEVTYYWYASKRIHQNAGGYSGRLLHGDYNVYNADGKLMRQGTFSQGLKTGQWKYWDERGTLLKIESWKKGYRDGCYCQYNYAGKLIKMCRYDKNLKQGKEKIYLADSVIVNKYKKGKLEQPKVKSPKPIKEKKEKTTQTKGKKENQAKEKTQMQKVNNIKRKFLSFFKKDKTAKDKPKEKSIKEKKPKNKDKTKNQSPNKPKTKKIKDNSKSKSKE